MNLCYSHKTAITEHFTHIAIPNKMLTEMPFFWEQREASENLLSRTDGGEILSRLAAELRGAK